MVNALWYERNEQIRNCLMVRSVAEEIKRLCDRHETRIDDLPTGLANKLYSEGLPRRLRRKRTSDLLSAI